MKKIFLVIITAVSLTAYSQSSGALSFESKVGNYGEIKTGSPAEIDFVFKNTSQATVEIKDVKSNTRAITYKIKDKLVKPGQASLITVIYNTKEVGPVRNTISVITSGEPSIYTLAVRGNVVNP